MGVLLMALTGSTASYPLLFPPNTDVQYVHSTLPFLALGLIPVLPRAVFEEQTAEPGKALDHELSSDGYSRDHSCLL